ncbi:MAG: hypothetical protein HZB31_04300 [Nitrospirae bacterium]|nr:hypothetical protein [Nitrospirota bacterium]
MCERFLTLSETIINVRSYVVYGTEMTEGLLAFLLHENDKLNLGAFGLDDENNIFLEHTILGNTCQKAEFEASLFAILSTSDKYDDEIVSRWGGIREADR